MLHNSLMVIFLLAMNISCSIAGTLTGSNWTPSRCGAEPVPPTLKLTTEDSYNETVLAINAWQQKASAYNTCVVNEANADNANITKSANAQQERFRQTVEKIKAETAAANAKLGG
jgi:hypothetical protein